MANLVSNEYYTNTYHGKYTDIDTLSVILSRAQDDIQCAATTDITKYPTNEYLLKAICAQAEYLDYDGGYAKESRGNIESESLEGYSYKTKDGNSGVTQDNLSMRALRLLRMSGLRSAVLYTC